MNDVPLYHRYTEISRRDSLQSLQDYANLLNWRPDGSDSVLDAGCGPGDITQSIILPFLPPKFSRLMGIDISDKMIDYARKTYTHPKLTFEQFNLDVPVEKQSLAGVEPFDHIFSSYCLMWISQPTQCLANFYNLLNPGGDLLVWFLPSSPTRDVYKDQARNSRFCNYMTDIDQFVSPYHYWTDPADEFRKLLMQAGFTNLNVKVEDKGFNRSYAAMQGECGIHSRDEFKSETLTFETFRCAKGCESICRSHTR